MCPSNPRLVSISPSLQHLGVTLGVDLGCNTISYNISFDWFCVGWKQLVFQMVIVMWFGCFKQFALSLQRSYTSRNRFRKFIVICK